MSRQATIDGLAAIVGHAHVLTGERRTRRFRRGYRFGEGQAIAVVRPGTLLELWRVVSLCAASDLVVVMQAANTGLTGGSTPDVGGYDRDVVIVSTLRLDGIRLLGDGQQVVCQAGATLNALEERLKPLGREPHSVIGSSCIGASVIGGIASNSGGSLIRRGPAYTEMALFARIEADGTVRLVNRLGIDLGGDAENILARLDSGTFAEDDVHWYGAAAHDADYATRVRDIDAGTPARFNGDTQRMFDAAGSAGHVVIFAVRLDTFPAERNATVFYIGSNDPADLQAIRHRFLADPMPLPIAAEYMHRDAFELADRYGKDTFLLIERLGTARIPALFAWKGRLDTACERLPFVPAALGDRLMQAVSRLLPDHLPSRLRRWRDRFEHHLILKVGASEAVHAAALLEDTLRDRDAEHFRCTPEEAGKAFLHRFVAAGAAVRYRALHPDTVEDIVAIDVALPRNLHDWLEVLPPQIEAKLVAKLYYGHFFCHVLHQDYVVAKGQDCHAIEEDILALLRDRGCRYPAEHNYGHLYAAEPEVLAHYRALDPCNCLNPGIGKSSKRRFWVSPDPVPSAANPSFEKVACHVER